MQSGGALLQKKKRRRPAKLVSNLQRHARDQAAAAARCVPWQLLWEARNQYLEWQEFYHWARSIIECDHAVPDSLAKKLAEACPGFLEHEREYLCSHPKESSLIAARLGLWIDDRIFGFAKRGGWFLATSFYAVRESRYQKASAYWLQSVENWRNARPTEYPSFEQWLGDAARCDDSTRLLPSVRKQRECFKFVSPDRLAQAVSRYIDWEAFAYWARSRLLKPTLPFPLRFRVRSICDVPASWNSITNNGRQIAE